jgi:hypothetical protein
VFILAVDHISFYLSLRKLGLFTLKITCVIVITSISHRVTSCNMKGTMMKRRNSIAMAGLLAGSLVCSSSNSLARNNDGFIAGACAVGAALFGVAGAVALADWCFSETDDQMIERITVEYRTIHAQYKDTMNYFGRISGMNHYVYAAHKPFNTISESALHEFATFVWDSNRTQHEYRSAVITAKNQLKDSVQKLRKRAHALEGKHCKCDDQRRLSNMRLLLAMTDELLVDITLFADCLNHHHSYFNLYDTVDTLRGRYLQELTIFESGYYTIAADLKRCIVGNNSGQYALRSFVISIESDIAKLKSDIRSLAYNYPAKRQYVNGLLNELTEIKSIIKNDPRYQQELYEWEQARLQRLQLELLEAQARAERDRLNALRQQNRILEERNRIERERLRKEESLRGHMMDVLQYEAYQREQALRGNVDVTVSFTL